MLLSMRARHLSFLFTPVVLGRARAFYQLLSNLLAKLGASPRFTWGVAAIWSILRFILTCLWKLSHFIVSYHVFVFVYERCQRRVDNYIPGKWWEHYPYNRHRFMALLGTVPIWGLCMAVIMIISFSFTPIWTCVALWRTRKYQPVALDLRPLDQQEEDEFKTAPRRPGDIAPESMWSFLRRAFYVILFVLYIAMALSGIYLMKTYENVEDFRWKADVEQANLVPRRQGYGNGEKIFIGAMFRNNEAVLPHWTKQIARYINYAGVDNVFVSILESNSDDATVQMLEQFDALLAEMGVARRVITHDNTPHDDRISFLSAVRNRVLEPLIEKGGYDTVLFSNDVFIEAESIVELIKTRDGDYDFVCGLDFGAWGLYDQWVIRDRLGRSLSTNWPYFFEDSGLYAMFRQEPAPVFTCWNGIVAFKADPFLPVSLRKPGRLSTSPLSKPLPSSHPAYPQPSDLTPAETAPLLFRPNGKNEPCFTSESFNLPYDFRRQFDLQNIYVNARVITAYEWDFYLWHKYLLRHWAVKWFVEEMERGRNYASTKLINGNPDKMWTWDGGDCHPWGW